MLTVLLGLSTAFVFGAADFFGGMAAKRISPLRVTAFSAVIGFVTLLIAHSFFGGAWTTEAVVIGAICGVTGAVAVVLLYGSLAIGPMSILSPLTAIVSAIVPLTVGLAGGDQLEFIGYVALGIALVAVVLVGFVPEKDAVRPSLRGILMAVGSGVTIGVFLVLIDLTPEESNLIPLVVARVVTATLMLGTVGILALGARRALGVPRTAGTDAGRDPLSGQGPPAFGATLPAPTTLATEAQTATRVPWRSVILFIIGCGYWMPRRTPACCSVCA